MGDDYFDNRTGAVDLAHGSLSHSFQKASASSTSRVSVHILASVIDIYDARMYPVWPVIEVDKLLEQLQDEQADTITYVLATSLCAATMAQLHLSPISFEGQNGACVTSQYLERECCQARATCNYRERPKI